MGQNWTGMGPVVTHNGAAPGWNRTDAGSLRGKKWTGIGPMRAHCGAVLDRNRLDFDPVLPH